MAAKTKTERRAAAAKAARTRKRNRRQEEAQAARVTNEAGEATAPPAGPNPKVESKHTRKTTRRGRGKDPVAGGGFVADAKPTKEQKVAERKSRKGKRQPNRNPRDARSGYTDHVLPNRAAGDVEISQRADPHKNVRRHDIVGGGSVAKVLPVKSEKGKKRTVQASGFAPGETVTIHHGHLEQNDSGRAPWSAPLDRAKVRNDGTVEIQVPDGQFVLAGEITRPAPNPVPGGNAIKEKRWHYTGVAFS